MEDFKITLVSVIRVFKAVKSSPKVKGESHKQPK